MCIWWKIFYKLCRKDLEGEEGSKVSSCSGFGTENESINETEMNIFSGSTSVRQLR